MSKDVLVFRPHTSRENSKVMRVSDSFDELVSYIKIKTNLPVHVITQQIAAYMVDKIVIDDNDSLFSLGKE